MSLTGEIVTITNEGYFVKLEDGEIGLIPVEDANLIKYGNVYLNKLVEVRTKYKEKDIYILESTFSLMKKM